MSKLTVTVDFHGFTRSVELASEDGVVPESVCIRIGPERKPGDDPARDARLVEFALDHEAQVYRCAGCVFCERLGLAVHLVTGALSPRLEALRESLVELRHGLHGRSTVEQAASHIHDACDRLRESVAELADRMPKKRRRKA